MTFLFSSGFIIGCLISESFSFFLKSQKKRCQITVLSTILIKFVFSKKATKIDEIFTVDLTVTTYCQINGEDFFQILWPS